MEVAIEKMLDVTTKEYLTAERCQKIRDDLWTAKYALSNLLRVIEEPKKSLWNIWVQENYHVYNHLTAQVTMVDTMQSRIEEII